MARLVAEDVEVGGCPMKDGDWTLLSFPSANRDPEAFDHADEFVIDRQRNRHTAFGLGIHRCVGSNLARMEITRRHRRVDGRLPRVRAGRCRRRHLVDRPGPWAAIDADPPEGECLTRVE